MRNVLSLLRHPFYRTNISILWSFLSKRLKMERFRIKSKQTPKKSASDLLSFHPTEMLPGDRRPRDLLLSWSINRDQRNSFSFPPKCVSRDSNAFCWSQKRFVLFPGHFCNPKKKKKYFLFVFCCWRFCYGNFPEWTLFFCFTS